MKKHVIFSLVFILIVTGAAFADNLKIRALTMTAVDVNGAPWPWCYSGESTDGIFFFEAKGSGNVSVKVQVYDSAGVLTNIFNLGTFSVAGGNFWEKWQLTATFPCISPGIYKAVAKYKVAWSGASGSVETKIHVE